MIIILFVLIIIAIVAIFSVQNAASVTLTFLFWRLEASLAIVIFLSVLTGVIVGVIVVSFLKMKLSMKKLK